MKRLIKFGFNFYFNKIEINGLENLPDPNTPIIFAPNHQGAFLDALIIGVYANRPIYSLARASVFDSPFVWFLEALKMIPIYRIRDGYAKLSLNEAVFIQSTELLLDNKSMLIFPEAAHHQHYYINPLTKGLARIALRTQTRIKEPLLIIPTGINYFRASFPRHKLILNFGKAISTLEFSKEYEEQEAKGLKSLNAALSSAMKNQMVIPDNDSDHVNYLSIFSRKNESLSFSDLKNLTAKEKTLKEKNYPLLVYVSMIFLLPNFLAHLISYYIINNKIKEVEFYGSIKYALGLFLFPFWWLLSFLLIWNDFGLVTAGVCVLIQIMALLLRQELLRYTH